MTIAGIKFARRARHGSPAGTRTTMTIAGIEFAHAAGLPRLLTCVCVAAEDGRALGGNFDAT